MDMTHIDPSSSQNWLAFSLSNPHLPTSHDLSLFQPFNTANPSGANGVVDHVPKENGTGGSAADLSMFTSTACNGGPKLEDFLGGCTSTGNSGARASEAPPFSGETQVITLANDSEIYDSELKTIAASFLRGFSSDTQNQLVLAAPLPQQPAKKAIDTFGQRTSIYRGVTRHRWTGRYEAHLWDNSCRREGQTRKGRQVYLGGYDKEDKAARAYDLAALKYWGPTTTTNFTVSNYERELEEMKNMTRQEFVASLRRKSSGFSRGASIYRGVTRHHQHGRWQARIGRVAGNKDLYLGTFSTQEEAAEAYDIAAIKFRGLNAVTNFDMSRYDVKSIASSNLPIGGMNKSKTSSESISDSKSMDGNRSDDKDLSSSSSVTFATQPATPTLSFGLPMTMKQDPSDFWSILGYQQHSSLSNAIAKSTSAPFHGTKHFTMDFPPASSSVNETNNNNGLFSGNYMQQQSNSNSSLIPFATPIGLNGNNSSYEGSTFGNWIAPSLHQFQHAKPNLSVFQTPIFGME